MASQHPDIEKVLFTQEDIDGIVSRLGEQITRDYAGKDLVLIAVLRGAVVFMGDLMRKIELPTNIDFMAVSRAASPPRWRLPPSCGRTLRTVPRPSRPSMLEPIAPMPLWWATASTMPSAIVTFRIWAF